MSDFVQVGERVVNLSLIVACHREPSRVFVHYWPGNTWSYKTEEGGRELWEAVVGRSSSVYNPSRPVAPQQG